MKRKCLSSLLALWVLAFTSPAWSFACGQPCKMTQKQMMDCARSCSEHKPANSIGRGDCVKLHVQAAPVFTAAAGHVDRAPIVSALAPAGAPALVPCSAVIPGQTLRGPPQYPPSEFPTANAPPQLI